MNKKLAIRNILDFTSCLDDKYFLVYGTALGALRENDIISHDLDIDIGIMEKDFNWKMVNKIFKKGFSLVRIFGMKSCGFEMTFKRNEIRVDLMFFYTEGGLIWNSLWLNNGLNGLSDMLVHSYNPNYFEIEEKILSGFKFYSLGENYIKSVYGDNWKTPVKEWDWKTSHFCIDNNLKIELIKKYGY